MKSTARMCCCPSQRYIIVLLLLVMFFQSIIVIIFSNSGKASRSRFGKRHARTTSRKHVARPALEGKERWWNEYQEKAEVKSQYVLGTNDFQEKEKLRKTNFTTLPPITKISLLGERNSGTTWISDVLQKCFRKTSLDVRCLFFCNGNCFFF